MTPVRNASINEKSDILAREKQPVLCKDTVGQSACMFVLHVLSSMPVYPQTNLLWPNQA